MKTKHVLLAAPFLLILGALAGREFSPKTPPSSTSESSPSPDRSERKIIRVQRPSGDQAPVSATDLAGLFALVNPQAPFETSTRLRAALGDLGPDALETYLIQLNKEHETKSEFHILRASLLNHLIAKDPFQALDMLLAHEDPDFRSANIYLVMSGAARLNLEAAREALALIDDQQLQQQARNSILNATADLSSDQLLSLLSEESTAPNQSQYFGDNQWNNGFAPIYYGNSPYRTMGYSNSPLTNLAQKDLAAAEKYALGLKTPKERNSALLQIARGLAQEDPDIALEWIRRNGDEQLRDQNLGAVLTIMASRDPIKAVSHLDEITNVLVRDNMIYSISSLWAKKDPQAAIAWLEGLPLSKTRGSAFVNVTYTIAESDPLAAIKLIEQVPRSQQNNTLSSIIDDWKEKDFDAARNWITSQTNATLIAQTLPSFISTWAEKDAASAAAYLTKSTAEGLNRKLKGQFSNVASLWANKDKGAALLWAQNLENKDDRNSAIGGVYNKWASQDPAEAAQHLATLSDADERSTLLNAISSNWGTRDPEAAQNWLATLPPDERFKATSATINDLEERQPELAAEIFDRMTTDPGFDSANFNSLQYRASSIASSWSEYAPQDAAEWASQLTSEDAQAIAFKSITYNWAEHEPVAAANWVDTLPTGKPRDLATEELVRNIQQIDPPAAFDWADSITDDDKRYNTISDTLNQWKRHDKEAAIQAAHTANITGPQLENLLQHLR